MQRKASFHFGKLTVPAAAVLFKPVNCVSRPLVKTLSASTSTEACELLVPQNLAQLRAQRQIARAHVLARRVSKCPSVQGRISFASLRVLHFHICSRAMARHNLGDHGPQAKVFSLCSQWLLPHRNTHWQYLAWRLEAAFCLRILGRRAANEVQMDGCK